MTYNATAWQATVQGPRVLQVPRAKMIFRARAPKVRGPIEIGPFLLIIRARAPKVRGPIEIVPVIIIRARAPKVRGPIEIGPFLLIIIIQAL